MSMRTRLLHDYESSEVLTSHEQSNVKSNVTGHLSVSQHVPHHCKLTGDVRLDKLDINHSQAIRNRSCQVRHVASEIIVK
jgi:hypothetical protein